MKRRFFIIAILCLFSIQSTLASDPNNNVFQKDPYKSNGLNFMSLSTGAGIWYNSLQAGMVNEQLPIAIYLEYGKTESPWGIILGANFYSTYTLDNFLMNPNYFSLLGSYEPLKKIIPVKNLKLQTLVGFNMAYSTFTEKEYPGIVDYQHKIEKQFSFGIQLGANIMYSIKNIEIGPSFMYHYGKADFIAGYFSPQTFDIGSLQLNLLIKYKLVFNPNKNACPAYRNFNRFQL